MSTIKYRKNKNGEVVYLDGKRVGTIWRTATGWAYFPRGKNTSGETFPSLEKAKQSLEEP